MDVSVAIISDTHGYLDPRIEAIVQDCDYVVHAGDVCGASVLTALQPKNGQVIAVAGNNDPHWMPTVRLPKRRELVLPSGKICLEHGDALGRTPSHAALRQQYADARLIVYGHTHKLVVDKTFMPWVVNPGAAGKTRTHGGASCLVLQASSTEWTLKTFRFPD